MNNNYFPAINRYEGAIASNHQIILNPLLSDGIGRKVELSDLFDWINDQLSADAVNIYNNDGTLSGNRILTGDSKTLLFEDVRSFNVFTDFNDLSSITLTTYSTSDSNSFSLTQSYAQIQRGFGAIENFLILDDTYSKLSYADASGGGSIEASPIGILIKPTLADGKLYIETPAIQNGTATTSQFLKVIDAVTGEVEFATPSSSNIYNIDGTLTGNRTLTGNNLNLTFTDLGDFIVTGDTVLGDDFTVSSFTDISLSTRGGVGDTFNMTYGSGGVPLGIMTIISNGLNGLQLTTTQGSAPIELSGEGGIRLDNNGGDFFLKTAAVNAATATVDQVLVLQNVSGIAEWESLTSGFITDFSTAVRNEIIANLGLNIAIASGNFLI